MVCKTGNEADAKKDLHWQCIIRSHGCEEHRKYGHSGIIGRLNNGDESFKEDITEANSFLLSRSSAWLKIGCEWKLTSWFSNESNKVCGHWKAIARLIKGTNGSIEYERRRKSFALKVFCLVGSRAVNGR